MWYNVRDNKRQRRCKQMTLKDYSEIQRQLGYIEGIAVLQDQLVYDCIISTIDIIDEVLKRNIFDGDESEAVSE